MKLLLISDAHANPWALQAVEPVANKVDQVLFAGDAVNYGPSPGAVLKWLRAQDVFAVRGNHDQAVAWGQDPQASPAKARLARLLASWTREQLDPAGIAYLQEWPLTRVWEGGGVRIRMVHATPKDPLFDYRLQPGAADAVFQEACAGVQADLLLVGHTHFPLIRRVGSTTVVNPGSLGQPLDGDPRACYALWEDGELRLLRLEYDRMPLLQALERLPLEPELKKELPRLYREARL